MLCNRAIQEANGNVSLEIIRDICAEYIKFTVLNTQMVAEVVVMDEITRVECKGKKEMRAKV